MTRMTASVTVEDGRLLFDGVDVAALGGRVDTPFFLYSQRRIAANVAAVRRAFESRHAATRVFFAGKACSNLWFLEQVRAAGAGIEVNSGGELWKALRAGFSPDQAVFNGVAKSRSELEEAVTAGIAGVVADSLCELRRLEEVARDLGQAGARAAARGRQRHRRHAPRPRDRQRRQGRHRPRRGDGGVPPRRRAPSTSSSPACTCTSARRSRRWSRTCARSGWRSTCSTTSSASSA